MSPKTCCGGFFYEGPECQLLPAIFFPIIDIAILCILFYTAVSAYDDQYGSVGADQFGIFIVDSFVFYLLYTFMNQMAHTCLAHPTVITSIIHFIFGAAAALLCFFAYFLAGEENIAIMEDLSFANWHLQNEYLLFEHDWDCIGLAVAGDPCNTSCCDSIFKTEFENRMNSVTSLLMSSCVLICIVVVLEVIFYEGFYLHRQRYGSYCC